MDTLGAMESYVSAVRSGSLSGAARQRRMTQPAISQQITALENQFDAKLLSRNRSGVRMTQTGEVVYKHAVAMLNERENLNAALETMTGEVAGRLVVTTNLAFPQKILGEVIIELTKLHPDLHITLRADDINTDLAGEEIDFALRSGDIRDNDRNVQKIGTLSILHVATPEYLDTLGRPKTPDELINLDFIQYKSRGERISMPLLYGNELIEAPIKVGLSAQCPMLVYQALRGNLGYTKAPEFVVADAIESGELEIVLPSCKIPDKDLFFVFPTGENHSPRVNALMHALLDRLGGTTGVHLVGSVKQALLDR